MRIGSLVLLTLWEVFVQTLAHAGFPRLFLHRRRRLPDETEGLYFRLMSGFTHGCWYKGNSLAVFLGAHARIELCGDLPAFTRNGAMPTRSMRR